MATECDLLVWGDDVLDQTWPDEAWLATVVDTPPVLGESDPRHLTHGGRLDLLRQVKAEQARLAAMEADLLVVLTGTAPRVRQVVVDDGADDCGAEARSFDLVDEVLDEISIATRQSLATVRRDVTTARRLALLPKTAAALAAGEIGARHADVIGRISDGLPAQVLARFDEQVAVRASKATVAETASFARRLRARLDAAGEETRRQEAKKHIDVRIWGEDDGLACLQARLPIEHAARLHAALQERARAVPYDPQESMGQRRVTALIDAICAAPESTQASATAGVPVAVQVTVDLASLLGLCDEPALITVPDCGTPEPVTAQTVRDLLADPGIAVTLRRLVTDPLTGEVLDRGRRAYRVSDALRAFLVARDRVCRFPHCTRPAESCDIDHIRPWSRGGETNRDNLIPLCRRHHVLKTHGRWEAIRRRPDGAVVWRAPDGSIVIDHPWQERPPPIYRTSA